MNTNVRTAWAAMAVVTWMAGSVPMARAGCTKDTDCKGDRVCEDGACVSPGGGGGGGGGGGSAAREEHVERGAEVGASDPTYKATLQRGLEGVGGNIILTRKAFHFRPHGVNFQTETLTIPYKKIKTIERFSKLGVIPNGLRVVTKSGDEHEFVVFSRDEIIEKVNARK